MKQGPQFVWWLGHVTMLVCTAFYLPFWATFNYKAGAHWYTRAFFGALVSYSVVVYKSFPVSARQCYCYWCWLLVTYPINVGIVLRAYHVFFNLHEEIAG